MGQIKSLLSMVIESDSVWVFLDFSVDITRATKSGFGYIPR